MVKNTKKAFVWIINILRKHKVPFCISGGLAAKIYGSKRPLADIDIEVADDGFVKILPEIKKYLTYGPERCRDKTYNLLLTTLKYSGQEIDLCGANSSLLFDKKNKKWIKERIPLTKAVRKKVYGLIVPIIPLYYLIYYKKIIGDNRDKILENK